MYLTVDNKKTYAYTANRAFDASKPTVVFDSWPTMTHSRVLRIALGSSSGLMAYWPYSHHSAGKSPCTLLTSITSKK